MKFATQQNVWLLVQFSQSSQFRTSPSMKFWFLELKLWPDMKYDWIYKISGPKTRFQLLCSIFQVWSNVFPKRGKILDYKPDRIFGISDLRNSYSNTVINSSSQVDCAYFKVSNLDLGAWIGIGSEFWSDFWNQRPENLYSDVGFYFHIGQVALVFRG